LGPTAADCEAGICHSANAGAERLNGDIDSGFHQAFFREACREPDLLPRKSIGLRSADHKGANQVIPSIPSLAASLSPRLLFRGPAD
jgi:hypothetical protein